MNRYVDVPGAFEGKLTVDGNSLQGEFINKTGIGLSGEAWLYYQGNLYPLQRTGGAWRVSTGLRGQLISNRNDFQRLASRTQYGAQISRFSEFKRQFINALLVQPLELGGQYGGNVVPNLLLPPSIIAWADTKPNSSLDVDARATVNFAATLVVAEVAYEVVRQSLEAARDIPVFLSGDMIQQQKEHGGAGPDYASWLASAALISPNLPADLTIVYPAFPGLQESWDAYIEVRYTTEPEAFKDRNGNFERHRRYQTGGRVTFDDWGETFTLRCYLDAQAQARGEPLEPVYTEKDPEGRILQRYKIDDWPAQARRGGGYFAWILQMEPADSQPGGLPQFRGRNQRNFTPLAKFTVSAKAVRTKDSETTGVNVAWQ